MGIAVIQLETDASQVKTAIEGDDYRLSAMGGVITEIKHLLASEFTSYMLSLNPRSVLLTSLLCWDVRCPVAVKPLGKMYRVNCCLWCPAIE
jgi:hypothetical protein